MAHDTYAYVWPRDGALAAAALISAGYLEAPELINWAASRALPNGMMSEQIHPFTDAPPSVCPLTWSHATFVLAVHEYMSRCRALHCSARYLHTTQR